VLLAPVSVSRVVEELKLSAPMDDVLEVAVSPVSVASVSVASVSVASVSVPRVAVTVVMVLVTVACEVKVMVESVVVHVVFRALEEICY
jgi:hypothetical protein